MMLMHIIHRHPRLFWPLLGASVALLAAGAMLLIA
jgi:hypothetical protein